MTCLGLVDEQTLWKSEQESFFHSIPSLLERAAWKITPKGLKDGLNSTSADIPPTYRHTDGHGRFLELLRN